MEAPPAVARAGTPSTTGIPPDAGSGIKYKFRRGAQRTVQKIDVNTLKEGQRVFQALHANEFAGPAMRSSAETAASSRSESEGAEKAPFFVDSEGKIYDVYYRKCDDEVTQRIRGGSGGSEDGVFRPFPQPADYESFFDYEQALLDWKTEVESALGDLHLPDIVGRYYSRPTVTAPIQELVEAYDENAMAEIKIEGRMDVKDETDDELSDELPASEKRLSVGSLNPKAIIKESDPWDANLLPPEPQPEFYKTFDEFEEALLRWAEICNSSLPYIPPHANQLEQLIPIQSQATADQARAARQFRNSNAHLTALSEMHDPATLSTQGVLSTGTSRPGLKHVDFFGNGPLSPSDVRQEIQERLIPPKDSLTTTSSVRRSVEKIPPPKQGSEEWQLCRNVMDAWVQKLLINRITIHKEHGSFNKPMLPVIHGTFPTAYKTPRTASYKPAPLRRRDLTEQMLEECYDCPEGIDGKKVEFNIPLVSIEPFDFALLHANDGRPQTFSPFSGAYTCSTLGTAKQGDRLRLLAGDSDVINKGEAYRVNRLEELRRENCRNRYDTLNACYYPLMPQHLHDKSRAQLEAVLESIPAGSGKMTLEQIEAILEVPLFLDQFQDRLSGPVPHIHSSQDSDTLNTPGEYIQRSISPPMFARLLQLYAFHANNPLFLAKLSLLVQDVISSSKGKTFIEELISSNSIKALSHLAFSISFLDDAPIDVFPFDSEMMQMIMCACKDMTLLGSFLDPVVEAVFKSVFTHYYLSIILHSIQSRSFQFLSLGSSFLQQHIEEEVKKLHETLKMNSKCLAQFIHYINHRSSRLSSFFLFITISLLRIATESAPVRSFFVAVDLMEKVRQLTRSRFSHVQYGVKLLWSLLQVAPWSDLFCEKYANDPSLFLRELSNPSPREKEPRTLLSSLFLDACLQSLSRVAGKKRTGNEGSSLACAFLWKDSYFVHKLYYYILDSDCSQSVPRTIETWSILLARLSHTLAQLKLIDIPLASKRDTSTKNALFSFNETRARRLLHFIGSIAPDHPLSYSLKTNMLLVLRNLVKAENAYPSIVTIPEFFSKLNLFCKDSNNQPFSRAAWGTFFTVIQRHAGVLEYMIEKNIISNFFEIISVVSGNLIIHNAIHYINKIFHLHAKEASRIEAGMDPKRHGDKCLNSVEKDVRALCRFFRDRKTFIRFQMISKRFLENPDPSQNHPGAAFIELVRLYRVINNSSACEKLKKDIFKNEEYKQSFLALLEKYSDKEEANPVTPRPRASDSRMLSLPAKDGSRTSEIPLEHKKGGNTKTAKKASPAVSPIRPFASEPITPVKKECDSPKRKWFGIKKKSKDSKDGTREG